VNGPIYRLTMRQLLRGKRPIALSLVPLVPALLALAYAANGTATRQDAYSSVVGQLLITSEWSDWRNRVVWWIQSVYVVPGARGTGVFRAMYEYIRRAAQTAGAAGLRLYVDTTNTRAQTVYAAVGMTGEHYKVFEEMFDEPPRPGTRS